MEERIFSTRESLQHVDQFLPSSSTSLCLKIAVGGGDVDVDLAFLSNLKTLVVRSIDDETVQTLRLPDSLECLTIECKMAQACVFPSALKELTLAYEMEHSVTDYKFPRTLRKLRFATHTVFRNMVVFAPGMLPDSLEVLEINAARWGFDFPKGSLPCRLCEFYADVSSLEIDMDGIPSSLRELRTENWARFYR